MQNMGDWYTKAKKYFPNTVTLLSIVVALSLVVALWGTPPFYFAPVFDLFGAAGGGLSVFFVALVVFYVSFGLGFR